MTICTCEACALRFDELGGDLLWNPALVQSAHTSLYGGSFIHVEASPMTICTWEKCVIRFDDP